MGISESLIHSVCPTFDRTSLAPADGIWKGCLCCIPRLPEGVWQYATCSFDEQYIGLHTNLLVWLFDYLTLRKQQVVVDGAISSQVSVVSGVPQGSVLGPLLFSIYINGITEVCITPQSHSVLYCDDVLLYHGISQSEQDLSALQLDINKLARWSDEQLLKLNPKKCNYMIMSKKRKARPNTGVSLYLEEVECFKYLCVLIQNNLTWSNLISGICSKAK